MQATEVAIALCGLPALRMFTFADAHHVGFILAEIQGFTRMDLTTHRFVEVFVGDLSIFVIVELVENILELIFT